MHSSVSTPTVHGECQRLERFEPLRLEMRSVHHRQNDGAKREVLELFRAQERLTVEEGNDSSHEVLPVAHHQHQRGVARTAMVLPDVSAAQSGLEEIEDLSPFRILADVELRYELPTNSCTGVPLDRYV